MVPIPPIDAGKKGATNPIFSGDSNKLAFLKDPVSKIPSLTSSARSSASGGIADSRILGNFTVGGMKDGTVPLALIAVVAVLGALWLTRK